MRAALDGRRRLGVVPQQRRRAGARRARRAVGRRRAAAAARSASAPRSCGRRPDRIDSTRVALDLASGRAAPARPRRGRPRPVRRLAASRSPSPAARCWSAAAPADARRLRRDLLRLPRGRRPLPARARGRAAGRLRAARRASCTTAPARAAAASRPPASTTRCATISSSSALFCPRALWLTRLRSLRVLGRYLAFATLRSGANAARRRTRRAPRRRRLPARRMGAAPPDIAG